MASFHNSLCILFPFFFTLLCFSDAYNFNVGSKDGWTLHPSESYNQWSSRLRFIVNDTLHFKYNSGSDSVLEVSKSDYDSCNTNSPITALNGGDSVFNLNRPGPFYFISGNKSNCDQGQKLTVVVISPKKKQTPSSGAPAPAKSFSPIPVSPVSSPPESGTPVSTSPASSPPKPETPVSTSPAASPGGGMSSSPTGNPADSPGGGGSSSPTGSPATSPAGGVLMTPPASSPVDSGISSSPTGGPAGGPADSPVGGALMSPTGNPSLSPTGNPGDVNAPAPTGSQAAVPAALSVPLGMIIFVLGWVC